MASSARQQSRGFGTRSEPRCHLSCTHCWRSCPSVLLVCSRETRDVGVLQGSQLPPRSALCNLSCPGEAPCHGFYPSSLRCKARPGKSAQHFPGAHPSSSTGTGSASFSPFYHPRPPAPRCSFPSSPLPPPQARLMGLGRLWGLQPCGVPPSWGSSPEKKLRLQLLSFLGGAGRRGKQGR